MDIELRLLRSFAAVYETGSVSRAAATLSCTQQAMSMRIKMLESQIGQPLFLRRPAGLEPTPRGVELYARALTVLSAYDEMMSAVRVAPTRDRLRIGMPDDYASGFLGPLITGLWTDFTGAEVDLACHLSAQLVVLLDRREIDLCLVTTTAPPAGTMASFELPLFWLMSADRRGGSADLAAYPEGCVFRRAMTQTLDAAGLPWRVAVQSPSQAGIFAAVRSGVAVTAVVQGTEPDGLITRAETADLPLLPRVALHLVLSPAAPPLARRAAKRLAAHLDALCLT